MRLAFLGVSLSLPACGYGTTGSAPLGVGDARPQVPLTAGFATVPDRAKIVLVGSGWKGPGYIAVDGKGSVYVADYGSLVKEVSPPFTGRTHGKIRIIQKYFSALGIAVDSHENVYVSEDSNPGYIEQITPQGVINTVCSGVGTGLYGIAVDSSENVYAAGGNDLYLIRHKRGGGWKTPVRTGPKFKYRDAAGIAVDAQHNLYVTENGAGNGVEKIEPSGKIITIGSGFKGPDDVAVGPGCKAACAVYVADTADNAIKKVSPPFTGPTHGKITEIGYGFSYPGGVAAWGGNAYVADTYNRQVKEVIP
jgi:streptogramin lyase